MIQIQIQLQSVFTIPLLSPSSCSYLISAAPTDASSPAAPRTPRRRGSSRRHLNTHITTCRWSRVTCHEHAAARDTWRDSGDVVLTSRGGRVAAHHRQGDGLAARRLGVDHVVGVGGAGAGLATITTNITVLQQQGFTPRRLPGPRTSELTPHHITIVIVVLGSGRGRVRHAPCPASANLPGYYHFPEGLVGQAAGPGPPAQPRVVLVLVRCVLAPHLAEVDIFRIVCGHIVVAGRHVHVLHDGDGLVVGGGDQRGQLRPDQLGEVLQLLARRHLRDQLRGQRHVHHLPVHVGVPEERTVGDGGAGRQLAILFPRQSFARVVIVGGHIVVVVVAATAAGAAVGG